MVFRNAGILLRWLKRTLFKITFAGIYSFHHKVVFSKNVFATSCVNRFKVFPESLILSSHVQPSSLISFESIESSCKAFIIGARILGRIVF